MRITLKTPVEGIYQRACQLYRFRILAILFLVLLYAMTRKWGDFTLENLWPLYLVVLIELFVNCPYRVFFKNSASGFQALVASVVIDFLAVTATLHLFGSVDPFIYASCLVISIVYCALNLPVFLILQMAILASVLYAGLIILGHTQIIPQTIFFGPGLSRGQEIAIVIRHIAFFCLMALLVRSLASSLSKKDERLDQTLRELRETSEKVKYAYHLQTEYFSHMSHDIRAPLNSMLGFSQLLLESPTEPPTEKQRDFLTRIKRSAKHLRDLVNDVLDLSRIESRRMQLLPRDVELVSVIGTVLDLFYEEAAQKGLVLKFTEKPASLKISADELKLRQVLYNLLSNAIKFTAHGFVHVRLSAEPDGGARITVEDSGQGIAPEDQSLIFRPYEQTGRATAASLKGTGLGLAISQKFVKMHGGKIRVESVPDKGSRFILTLPSVPSLKVETPVISKPPEAAV
jgi:signal transduction histidine kinase